MKQDKFLYFSPLSFDTVFKTQVIGWVNLYREAGLDFEIVKIVPVKNILNRKKQKSDKKGIKQLFSGRFRFLYSFPERYFIGRSLNIFSFFLCFLVSGIVNRRVVVQIRASSFHKTFRILKKIFGKRFLLIYDSRAAAAEEYIYSKTNISSNVKKKYEAIKERDRRMIQVSDKVFCVSNILIQYHKNLVGKTLDSNKFFLYPCSADERIFYYKDEVRRKMRKQLGVVNRTVIVYSGGLEMPWHVPKQVFGLFSRINKMYTNAFFLVLTNDEEVARRYFFENSIPEQDFLIESVDNSKVYEYLNASDLGVLLRDDHLMNNVASPTKFAEYLMCGLPVIISPNVGDFSELVFKQSFGLVYADDQEVEILKPWIQNIDVDLKKKISAFGTSNFSKQSRLNGILDIYRNKLNK